MLNTSISSRAIEKRVEEMQSEQVFILFTRLRDEKAHELILLNSPFYCLKGPGEEEDVLSYLFYDSLSPFIINNLADGFPAISLKETVFKKKLSILGSFLRSFLFFQMIAFYHMNFPRTILKFFSSLHSLSWDTYKLLFIILAFPSPN